MATPRAWQSLSAYFRVAEHLIAARIREFRDRNFTGGMPKNPLGLTGPIRARAVKSQFLQKLDLRGHHDWPVKPTIRSENQETLPRTPFGPILREAHISATEEDRNASDTCATWA